MSVPACKGGGRGFESISFFSVVTLYQLYSLNCSIHCRQSPLSLHTSIMNIIDNSNSMYNNNGNCGASHLR